MCSTPSRYDYRAALPVVWSRRNKLVEDSVSQPRSLFQSENRWPKAALGPSSLLEPAPRAMVEVSAFPKAWPEVECSRRDGSKTLALKCEKKTIWADLIPSIQPRSLRHHNPQVGKKNDRF